MMAAITNPGTPRITDPAQFGRVAVVMGGSSAERTAALSGWLDRYNWRRPHGSLNHRPPGDRLAQLTNVGGIYI